MKETKFKIKQQLQSVRLGIKNIDDYIKEKVYVMVFQPFKNLRMKTTK